MQQPSEGLHFGKYTLLERIATGGMAEIYRARMTAVAGVTKPVVIKKILPGFAGNPAFVSMFVNEARIAAGLSHGNIAQVFDFGEMDGQYFIAMEWVDGRPLSRVLRRARDKGLYTLPQPLALLVAVEVLKGLAYAHTRLDERGRPLHIIHRDISPQNVLLSYEGQVKLVDFGIARARLAGRGDTEEGDLKGKYAYFAPEQARGRELDARADIFAVGVVLYEMLCGRLPFEGRMADVLRKAALGDFPRPRDLNPDISPALERILLTALAVEREQRYPTAEAFAEALNRYLHTAAPDVSSSALAHFMAYLFEADLVAEGRPVLLPREFLSQMARWAHGPPERRAPREAPPPWEPSPDLPPRSAFEGRREHTPPPRALPASHREPVPSASEERRERITQPIPVVRDSAEPAPAPPVAASGGFRLPRPVVLGAPALAAAVLASLAALMAGNTGTFSVELSSTPPGASIRVDGQTQAAVTPTFLTHLPADTEHLLEVYAPGMVPWSQTVRAERGTTLAVHARLRAKLGPAAPGPGVLASRPPRAPPPQEAFMPTGSLTLSAVGHAFRVPVYATLRVPLDPALTYGVRTEGRLSLGGPGLLEQAAFFVEGSEELPAHESFGLVGHEERLVHHATALYVFVLDARREDNHGALQVRVRERTSGKVTSVKLEARHHAVKLARSDRFVLRGMDPGTTYEVVVRDTAQPASTRGRTGGPVGRVLGLHGAGAGPEDGAGVLELLEVGQPVRLRGAAWLQLAFPDDNLADNSGTLLLEVSPVPAPAGPPPGPGGMFDGSRP